MRLSGRVTEAGLNSYLNSGKIIPPKSNISVPQSEPAVQSLSSNLTDQASLLHVNLTQGTLGQIIIDP